MAIRINKNGRSISVSKNNGYTIEKVQKAIEFVKHAKRRSTRLEEYLDMYNYLKDANDTMPNCKVCGSAKYIAAVDNYAKYGYLTLVANGVDGDILNGLKSESDGDKKETDTVETQDSAQTESEDADGIGYTAADNSVVADEADTVEDEKTVRRGRPKKKNKESN